MQEYLKRDEQAGRRSRPRCCGCRSRPATSRCRPGTSLLLGRDPAESLVAAAFSRYENVSRRHATVTMDDSGHASIRDEHSTNGTFVNGDRVLPGIAVRLADGDVVRLAADVSAEVLLPRQEPDPSSLSRPDRPERPGCARRLTCAVTWLVCSSRTAVSREFTGRSSRR